LGQKQKGEKKTCPFKVKKIQNGPKDRAKKEPKRGGSLRGEKQQKKGKIFFGKLSVVGAAMAMIS